MVHLLPDRIEFADVVILNKVDDAEPHQVDTARKILRSIDADARIIETHYSDKPTETVLDTVLFDYNKAHEHPFWSKNFTVMLIICQKPRNTVSQASST